MSNNEYATSNLYLCAFLFLEGFKHIKMEQKPGKKNIWQFLYKRTDELMAITDEFYNEREELEDFIEQHVKFTKKIKNKMRRG